jgi:hypothetical protein
MLAALGQRDVQRLGRRDRIVEEHLVEIAHPVEQQRVRILRLDLQVLRHHRRHMRVHAIPLRRPDETLAQPTKPPAGIEAAIRAGRPMRHS